MYLNLQFFLGEEFLFSGKGDQRPYQEDVEKVAIILMNI
jgi:hypothetical protein